MATPRPRSDKLKLHGTYRTPRFRIGMKMQCELRGELKIVALSDAPIPWPLGTKGIGARSLIVYRDLLRALRRESVTAICHWFGVHYMTAFGSGATCSACRNGTTVLASFGKRTQPPAAFGPGVKAGTARAAESGAARLGSVGKLVFPYGGKRCILQLNGNTLPWRARRPNVDLRTISGIAFRISLDLANGPATTGSTTSLTPFVDIRTGAPSRDIPPGAWALGTAWDPFDKWNNDGTLDEILSGRLRRMSSG